MEKKELNKMGKDIYEEYHDKMIKLGTAMFKYYGGNILSEDELVLIANSSAETKILAMDFVTMKTLNSKSYTNYCKNSKSIKILSRQKQKKDI